MLPVTGPGQPVGAIRNTQLVDLSAGPGYVHKDQAVHPVWLLPAPYLGESQQKSQSTLTFTFTDYSECDLFPDIAFSCTQQVWVKFHRVG